MTGQTDLFVLPVTRLVQRSVCKCTHGAARASQKRWGGGVSSLPVASAGADCRQRRYNFLLVTVSEQVKDNYTVRRFFEKMVLRNT
jgi:hypothetical protein